MDISVPCLHLHDCSDFAEITGKVLSADHNSSAIPTSILSFINSTSLPLSHELTQGMRSEELFDAVKREDWKIIAPPNCQKGPIFEKRREVKETKDAFCNLKSSSSGPSNNLEQIQSSISVVLPLISDEKIQTKFPPLVEVVIGEGEEAETRIAGIVYARFNEQDHDEASFLSDSTDASWDSA
mmetsp:Transcript_7529/g.11489  ORF Transcript_7529/g.11489 Transcript_7529/m.11489 type:complete len:183 (-) Transcript_7529:329-877(-)|eukprot:CAMPEP_0178916592 /NCGR_PEP_ID=MMETSP0786-20121207/12740_1 /TAXON_ID=186022 /ORGANISM="Thalassionema frauenfeldii, Strain CCMP 1798" /LENGTH=182 /DNA_ID=CAMNT_0020589975 /DNA_START=188 /DNA_END=736 /DNA_ORIENTATION=+